MTQLSRWPQYRLTAWVGTVVAGVVTAPLASTTAGTAYTQPLSPARLFRPRGIVMKSAPQPASPARACRPVKHPSNQSGDPNKCYQLPRNIYAIWRYLNNPLKTPPEAVGFLDR